ncbi:YoaK family protein [Herbiconiux ginsengi]|uniref:Uncharacterized membrane protein YoaK, UPF0700 family n=1 Tax=Herbiconiux ginsengi TaxID=381665 RepID=A0A1H3LVP5_9MICO|nr:YoaK family protein [Herbiconiux ginsengi]SDY68471.1 Uncharacterized membrane protein YoaK, UPF0700 family [Herbiconiux ginsengi]
MTTPPPRDHRPQSTIIALVLSFAAGATDAFAFLLLGGVFTANMTGNLVLAGLTERPNYPSMIVGVIVAIIAFVIGLSIALAIARPSPGPRRLTAVLALGLAAQVAVLIGWVLAPDRSSMVDQAPLIALSGFAMAMQTGVSKRIESRSGVSTTYVTGTITNLVSDFVDKNEQAGVTRIGVIVALVAGALCGSLLIGIDTTLGAVLPIVPATVGLLLLVSAWRSDEKSHLNERSSNAIG